MPHEITDELPSELSADEAALLREMPALGDVGQARRTFMMQTGGGGIGLFAANLLSTESALAQMAPAVGAASAPLVAQNVVKVCFEVNGVAQTLELDSRMVLDAVASPSGCLGSNTSDCSSPSATSRLQKVRQTTTGDSPVKPLRSWPDLNQLASTKAGVIQKGQVTVPQ